MGLKDYLRKFFPQEILIYSATCDIDYYKVTDKLTSASIPYNTKNYMDWCYEIYVNVEDEVRAISAITK